MIDDFRPKQPTPDTPRSAPVFGSSPEPIVRPAPEFRTPEQVATTSDPILPSVPPIEDEPLLPAHTKSKSKTIKLFRKWEVSKKKFIIILVAILLLAGGGTAYALTRPDTTTLPKATKKAAPVVAPAPKPIVSPLTGMTVTAEQRDRPVIGVMIENSGDARPQSGLKDAGVVYEAIAEAGITRFLALFQEQDTGNIGPVRSSRPYYLDWAMAFDAGYAHVGGSPDALQRIKDIQVRDLDQFFNPAGYHRITSRYAPHNVYTSAGALRDLAISKGYDKSTFTSWARKAEKPYVKPAEAAAPAAGSTSTTKKPASDTRTAATAIDFNISGAFYNAHFDYAAASNSYNRSEGGAGHNDADSKQPISPKNVVGLVMPYSLMADGYHSQYNTIGTGKAFFFLDGTVTTGTWTKGEPKTQFVFKDDAGKEIALNPGQTWVTVVAGPERVTYK